MNKIFRNEALRYDCLWWANFVGLLALNTPQYERFNDFLSQLLRSC
jgi:hypothetical protein